MARFYYIYKGEEITESELEKFFEVKEITYRDYKTKYTELLKVKDSYNAETKTIKVYMPNFLELAEKIAKIYNDALMEDYNCTEDELYDEAFTMENAVRWIVKFEKYNINDLYTENIEEAEKQSFNPFSTRILIAHNKMIDLIKEVYEYDK